MGLLNKLFGWVTKDYDVLSPFSYVSDEYSNVAEEYLIRFENDDTTPMEYVVKVLLTFLDLDREAAISAMLKIHVEGQCTFGPFTKSYATQLCNHILAESTKRKVSLFCEVIKAK